MNVLNPNFTTQFINIIPREYDLSGVLWLRNELRDKETISNVTCIVSNGYLQIPIIGTFKEGESYELEYRKTDDTVLYRGKLYCTSQTDLQNYHL